MTSFASATAVVTGVMPCAVILTAAPLHTAAVAGKVVAATAMTAATIIARTVVVLGAALVDYDGAAWIKA